MENLLRIRDAVMSLDSGAPALTVVDMFFGPTPRHPLMAPWLP
jgi:hypothetical protein